MRALTLVADRKIELLDVAPPARPGDQARRRSPSRRSGSTTSTSGVGAAWRSPSASCRSSSAPRLRARSSPIGPDVAGLKVGDRVVAYGALTCGVCKACREGRDNLCENAGGVMGFHIDGFARDLVNMPARLLVPIPPGVSFRDAACAPVAFATVQHMLFDNAKLEPGESILVQAGGSGIGTAAIKMAKAIGCTVLTTVGDDAKAEKAKALGADHVINYRTDRFEGVVRKLTGKKGVDVVFEHVGPDTFNGSLLCLKRGGTAGHLRLDVGAVDHHQSVPALHPAISHFRLVRRLAAQHPREPRQDGDRADAGDRHRGQARRFRARLWRGWKAGRFSEKSSSRSDDRTAIKKTARRERSARLRSGYCARSSSPIAGARRISPARIMRKVGPLLARSTASAASNCAARVPGKIRRRDRTNPRRRVGQSRPRRRRVRAPRRVPRRHAREPTTPTPSSSSRRCLNVAVA